MKVKVVEDTGPADITVEIYHNHSSHQILFDLAIPATDEGIEKILDGLRADLKKMFQAKRRSKK